MIKVLYITYDGLMEPLGKSQVLSYLEKISPNALIHIISFEKYYNFSNKIEINKLNNHLRDLGIFWHPLRYHKKNIILSTSFDIISSIFLGFFLIRKYEIKIIHARSYVPSVAALILKKILRIKFIFDMRGFWVEEKVDSGWSKNSIKYKLGKWFEKHFLINADHIVSLTRNAVSTIRNFDFMLNVKQNYTVIPTCADLQRFKPIPNKIKTNKIIIGYVGSVSRYMFSEVVTTYKIMKEIETNLLLLIVNSNEHDYIIEILKQHDLQSSEYELITATPEEMPKIINRMDFSIYYTKPVFSKIAMSPTRLAELLGCGVPCLSNYGIGDVSELIKSEKIGVILEDFENLTIQKAVKDMLNIINDSETSGRCVEVAHKNFSLIDGVKYYENIYKNLSFE